MDNFAIAVKAFIINGKGEILTVKRPSHVPHAPGVWDIPGGRLDPIDEDPFDGVKRETKEETGLDIEVLRPLMIDHFVRDDNQRITMIIFLCKAINDKVTLSEEHVEFKWSSPKEARNNLVHHFHKCVDSYEKYFLGKV